MYEYEDLKVGSKPLSWLNYDHDPQNTRSLSAKPLNHKPVLKLIDPDVPTGNPKKEDGIVSSPDVFAVMNAFNKSESGASAGGYNWSDYEPYDLDGNGAVAAPDIFAAISAFGTAKWPLFNSATSPLSLPVGKALQLFITSYDSDSTQLPNITVNGMPASATFITGDLTTSGGRKIKRGKFVWTPQTADLGKSFTINFKSDDGNCGSVCPISTLFIKVQ